MDADSVNGPMVAIVGETASGKSSLALELARQYDGEIIAADAWTVYRGFDIGTAKPSIAERSDVRHHLIDVADPIGNFTAADFKRLALDAIRDILDRGKLPILVGGSGLYIDGVLFDYDFLPPASGDLRHTLNGMSNEQLLAEVQKRSLDTNGVDTANNRRLIRLIETKGRAVVRKDLRQNTIVLGLTVPREQLNFRIGVRVEAMFAGGLVAEVERLKDKYGWDVQPMQGIGYREFKDYFEGDQTLEDVKAAIILNTKHLAKKQRTWFRKNKSIHWITQQEQAVDLVTTLLNNYRR